MIEWTVLHLYYGNYIATKKKNSFTSPEEKFLFGVMKKFRKQMVLIVAQYWECN